MLSIEVKGEKHIQWKNAANQYHRLNGPASVRWHDDGKKFWERWCQYGQRHRLNGPADVGWHFNGKKYWESWYLHGVKANVQH